MVAGDNAPDRSSWFGYIFDVGVSAGRSLLAVVVGANLVPLDVLYADDGTLYGHLEDISWCVAS